MIDRRRPEDVEAGDAAATGDADDPQSDCVFHARILRRHPTGVNFDPARVQSDPLTPGPRHVRSVRMSEEARAVAYTELAEFGRAQAPILAHLGEINVKYGGECARIAFAPEFVGG